MVNMVTQQPITYRAARKVEAGDDSQPQSLTILICDDHDIFRLGLTQLLQRAFGEVSVVEASNPKEMMDLLGTTKMDLVLLDISMPGFDGLEALCEVKATAPRMPVLILSGMPEEDFALRSLKCGAAGYLNKITFVDEAVVAIRKVLNGERYINSTVAEQLATAMVDKRNRPPHESLSEREFQVLRLIASGKAIKEIASHLSISDKTVSTYRARICAKTGLTSNVAIVRYALENQLID